MKVVSLLFAIATAFFAAEARAEKPQPRQDEPKHIVEPTIASSGKLLGVGIGMSMKEAREKLDPLREPDSPRDEKEKFGMRAYWKLRESEFDWIMVWANGERKIVRIRAVLRSDKQKPFDEIGNVADATKSGVTGAVWNIATPSGPVRINAFGQNGAAARISILAFDPALPLAAEGEEAE